MAGQCNIQRAYQRFHRTPYPRAAGLLGQAAHSLAVSAQAKCVGTRLPAVRDSLSPRWAAG